MDCIVGPEHEWERLDGRPVSAAFHLAEIRQALLFIRSSLPANVEVSEIDSACGDPLEALACLTERLAA
jgi:hypothetical protein